MADATPVARHWLLLRILAARRNGVTVEEAAKELHVHPKTIRRDLQMLCQVGFRLEEDRGPHGRKRWRMAEGSNGPAINFAVDEALALYLGRRFLKPLAGTPVADAADSAFKKIRSTFGKPALDYLEKLAGRVCLTTSGSGDYRDRGELVDRLLMGIEDRKASHVVYRSARSTEAVTYELHPYGLVFHRGSMYLVAFSRDHDEVRHFKVDRIEEVEVSRFPFQPLEGFDLSKHLADSFGVFHGEGNVEVAVRFSAQVARYVEESNWHTSQRLSHNQDGSLLATFHLSTTSEIKQWILSFGRHAEVLAPEELREELGEELAEMAGKYRAAAVSRVTGPVGHSDHKQSTSSPKAR